MSIHTIESLLSDIADSSDPLNKKILKGRVRHLIADTLDVKPTSRFDVEYQFHSRVNFMKSLMRDNGLKSLVLGISGGVDSLTAALICKSAVTDMRMLTGNPDYKFIAVKLPYKTQKDADYVELALETIEPDVIEDINIADMVDSLTLELENTAFKEKTDAQKDFIRGNIKARSRMMAQYALANTYGGMVIGTDHAAEAVSGFFTKFGDGACDVTPLTGLVKSQVRALAEYRGGPREIYEKVATADLEDLDVNKPDEEALGVSYDTIDAFLLCEEDISDEDFFIIAERYVATEHKRQQPISPFDA